jgi:hypothetical protein
MVGGMHHRLLQAIASAALGLLIVAGSAFIWIGLPPLGFWIAGRLTSTTESFLLFVLAVIPVSMIGFGWLLYRLGAAYEGLRLRRARSARPLVDVAMVVSAAVALVLMAVYFLVFGEMRLVTPP